MKVYLFTGEVVLEEKEVTDAEYDVLASNPPNGAYWTKELPAHVKEIREKSAESTPLVEEKEEVDPGKVISSILLKKQYGAAFAQVLSGEYLKPLPRARRARQTYQILKDLPTVDLYRSLYTTKFTISVGDAIEEAKGIIEELKEEISSWRDNMDGSGLENTPKFEEVSEAADALENIDVGEYEGPDGITFVSSPFDGGSRPDRAARAGSLLEAAASAIREYAEEHTSEDSESETPSEATEEVDVDSLNSQADELESKASEIQEVNFPSMF